MDNKINLLKEKRSLVPWGLRVPIWKMNFCSKLFVETEMPQTAICL